MATAAFVSVSEYLKTRYRPDCDYIDGELRERNVGEQAHGHTQVIVDGMFWEKRKEWRVRPLGRTRLQITPTRFRIPDQCVLCDTDPRDSIIAFAPLLCIEVLSSEEKLPVIQERVDDYARMGVRNIWAIGPWNRHGYYAGLQGFQEPADKVLRIASTLISINLDEIFAELDEF